MKIGTAPCHRDERWDNAEPHRVKASSNAPNHLCNHEDILNQREQVKPCCTEQRAILTRSQFFSQNCSDATGCARRFGLLQRGHRPLMLADLGFGGKTALSIKLLATLEDMT